MGLSLSTYRGWMESPKPRYAASTWGLRFRDWRRATVAAVLSAGFALAIGKVISELVDRAWPFVADPHGVLLGRPFFGVGSTSSRDFLLGLVFRGGMLGSYCSTLSRGA